MDFLVIGAQKAGTTWLYNRLGELEDFDLFPVKELHYFDRSDKYPSYSILKKPKLKDRLLDINWFKKMLRDICNSLFERDLPSMLWKVNYYFSNYTDEWYQSLAKSKKGITGDFTPAYAMLDEEDVRRMYDLLPKAKIIFLIRNPVERAWSSFRFYKRNKKTKSVDQAEAIQFFNNPGQQLRGDYLRTLATYQKVYPKDQILVGFYDAIKDQPRQLLESIVRFLGGTPETVSSQCKLEEKNNVSPKMDIPFGLETYLYTQHADAIKQLEKEFGTYASKWLDKDVQADHFYPVAFLLKN